MSKVFFTLLILIVACKTEKQKEADLNGKIHPVISKYIHSLVPGQKIDSLIIVSIDTLTPKKVELFKAKEYNAVINNLFTEIDDAKKDNDRKSRILRLSYSLNDVNEIRAAATSLKEADEHYGLLVGKINSYDSLSKLCIRKSDSIRSNNFIGYIANFRVKYSDTLSNVQQEINNGEVVITPDFKIKEKKSFIN